MKNCDIGVIGLGFVGTPIEEWFLSQRSGEVFVYDKFKKRGSIEEVNRADIIFIAVPTPFYEDERGYDDSAVIDSLESIKDGKTIVIKSTIVPGSTKKFQNKYKKKTILFNPEFLRAKTASEDYLNPDKQIIGYASEEGRVMAKKVIELLPKASYQQVIPSTEAELVKYFTNAYLATRVVFANEIYDLVDALGANYDTVKQCIAKDPRIGDSHFSILQDGYRGYGGGCLPKDTKALISRGEELGLSMELLKKVDEINSKIRKNNL
jgi:UDPglucose 6-dehydrogenase